MKKMILGLALGLITSQIFAASDVIRIGNDGSYPPFSEVNKDGKMTGFDIDIANAICAQLEKKCQFEQITWDGLIPSLKARKIDAIVASMNDNEKRRLSVSFTKPYYSNPGIFVREKDENITFDAAGLKGKTVGVLRGSIFDTYATDVLAKDGVIIKRYNNQDDANLDAKSGRIDFLFADKIMLTQGFLARDEGKNFVEFGPEIEDSQYFGNGISIAVRKDDSQLQNEINGAIDAIKANGTYAKISNQYFGYDIATKDSK